MAGSSWSGVCPLHADEKLFGHHWLRWSSVRSQTANRGKLSSQQSCRRSQIQLCEDRRGWSKERNFGSPFVEKLFHWIPTTQAVVNEVSSNNEHGVSLDLSKNLYNKQKTPRILVWFFLPVTPGDLWCWTWNKSGWPSKKRSCKWRGDE